MTAAVDTRWWHRGELTGKTLVWLAVLDWPSGPLWLAQSKEEAPDPDSGATVAYMPGLGPVTWGEEMDLWEANPQPRSLALRLDLDHLDVPALLEEGHNLHGARLRLYRHPRGSSRMVLYLDARVQDYDYGDPATPDRVVVNVEGNPWDDGATTHDADERITAATWSGANDRVQGEFYPKPFGRAGFAETVATTPAYPIKSNVVLVASGETIADKVDIIDKDGNRKIGCNLIQEQDGLGRVVSTADVTSGAGGPVTWAADERYWARWSAYSMPRAGASITGTQNAVTTAGHLIEWALGRSRHGWNMAAVASAVRALDGYIVDGAIVPSPDEQLTVWKWLASAVLPLLPVALIWTPGGLSLKVWRWDRFTPLATLTEGLDVHRVGGVGVGRVDDLANEVRVNYAYDADAGNHTKLAALVGSQEAADREAGAALYRKCAVSQARYRTDDGRPLVQRDEVSTDIVEDEATGRAISRWKAEARALPTSEVTLRVPQEMGWLRLGDEVAYTDASLSMTARRAVLRAVDYQDDGSMLWVLAVFDRAHSS